MYNISNLQYIYKEVLVDITLFLAAQIPPILYAATNLIDKTLLSKYFEEGGVSTLLIFSSLLALILVPVSYVMDTSVFSMSIEHIGIMVLVAVINLVLLWSYLSALNQDDPSTVIVFYQLVPVFTLVVGYFLLGETVSSNQGMAMVLIMIGTGVISFDVRSGSRGFKWKTIILMTIACACWSSETVIFKVVALEESVWPSLFWTSLAHGVLGICLFVGSKKNRKQFIGKFREHGKGILALNVLNEVFYLSGNTVAYFVAMKTAVVLVALSQTFQSIYVLVFEIILAVAIPSFASRKAGRGEIIQKIAALCICGAGTTLLFS